MRMSGIFQVKICKAWEDSYRVLGWNRCKRFIIDRRGEHAVEFSLIDGKISHKFMGVRFIVRSGVPFKLFLISTPSI